MPKKKKIDDSNIEAMKDLMDGVRDAVTDAARSRGFEDPRFVVLFLNDPGSLHMTSREVSDDDIQKGLKDAIRLMLLDEMENIYPGQPENN